MNGSLMSVDEAVQRLTDCHHSLFKDDVRLVLSELDRSPTPARAAMVQEPWQSSGWTTTTKNALLSARGRTVVAGVGRGSTRFEW